MDYYEKYIKYKNKYLHAKHTLGYDMSGGADPSKCYIFFQDVADADNFMSVVAFIQLYGQPTVDNPIHFVLTQRPENLGVPKLYKGGPFKDKLLTEVQHGPDNPDDALLVAEDGARRFIMFMHNYYKIGTTLAEAYKIIRVYNGGCPSMSSNLSHLTHKRDYLFDRADLLTPPRKLGELITADEYMMLEKKYNNILDNTIAVDYNYKDDEKAEDRQKVLTETINKALTQFKIDADIKTSHILRPLKELTLWITEKQIELISEYQVQIVAFLLAPLTGFANMFQIDEGKVLKTHLTNVYGQLFAWDNARRQDEKGNVIIGTYTLNPTTSNILKNQFNVDCDTDAVAYILQELDKCTNLENITWIPTEMVKNNDINASLKDIYENLQEYPNTAPLMALWRQWCTIKSGPQSIFDPSVIFHAREALKGNIQMVKTIKEIKYIQHYGHIFTVNIPWAKQEMNWNRNVYQITQVSEKTKHTAVLEMNDQQHIAKLKDLLLYKVL
jgi:hypothetical protein